MSVFLSASITDEFKQVEESDEGCDVTLSKGIRDHSSVTWGKRRWGYSTSSQKIDGLALCSVTRMWWCHIYRKNIT